MDLGEGMISGVAFGRGGLILRGFSRSVLMIHGCMALTGENQSINQRSDHGELAYLLARSTKGFPKE